MGTVDFNGGTKPAAYIFDGVGHSGPSVTNSGDRLFAQDFNIPASGGVQVPTAPGANLLSVTLSTSPDAEGTFGVFALDGLTNSDWTDAASPIKQRRTYINVPDGGGPLRIANVVVPGPITVNWTAAAASGLWHDGNNWDAGGTLPMANWNSILKNDALPSGQTADIMNDSTVHTVDVSETAGRMAVHLQSNVRLTVTNGMTLRSGGVLSGSGIIAGDVVNGGGIIRIGEPGNSLLETRTAVPEPSTQILAVWGFLVFLVGALHHRVVS